MLSLIDMCPYKMTNYFLCFRQGDWKCKIGKCNSQNCRSEKRRSHAYGKPTGE